MSAHPRRDGRRRRTHRLSSTTLGVPALTAVVTAHSSLAVIAIVAAMIVGLVETAMPQESNDRRIVWLRWLDHRRRPRGPDA